MEGALREIAPDEFLRHTPAGEEIAEMIMQNLREATEEQICDMLSVSPRLARECRRMIHDFWDKLTGLSAMEAFTGVVFRQIHSSQWNQKEWKYAQRRVRIVSSLYGLLRPSDIIKPYRLDYSAYAAPGDVPLREFWKKRCTIDLVNLIKSQGDGEVLDLLPAEAARCIDWKIVKRFAKVVKVRIMEPKDGGSFGTPAAGRLKELRGRLVEVVVERCVENAQALRSLDHPDFLYHDSRQSPGNITFVC